MTTTSALVIRTAIPTDGPDLRRAMIELQEHERRLHDSRLPGEAMVDAYLAWLLKEAEQDGIACVAEVGGAFAGFAVGWVKQGENPAETPDSNRCGYVSDICVLPAFRRLGVATRLLEALEAHLARAGVSRIRLFALAANGTARAAYERAGYAAYEVTYEKAARPG